MPFSINVNLTMVIIKNSLLGVYMETKQIYVYIKEKTHSHNVVESNPPRSIESPCDVFCLETKPFM